MSETILPVTVLATNNKASGFYGTCEQKGRGAELWDVTFSAVMAATGASAEAVRTFLDGRLGRIFADEVLDRLYAYDGQQLDVPASEAVAGAILQWQIWKVGRYTARALGIEIGAIYLDAMIELAANGEAQDTPT